MRVPTLEEAAADFSGMWAPRQSRELTPLTSAQEVDGKARKSLDLYCQLQAWVQVSKEETRKDQRQYRTLETDRKAAPIPPGLCSRVAEPPRTGGLHQNDTFL